MEAPKYIGAICETAGQFAYIYAIADTEHEAIIAIAKLKTIFFILINYLIGY